MRKKIVGILLAAVMLSVAVAGCGNQADGSSTVVDASDNDNGSSSSDSSERQTSGDNTITMMCWYEEGTMDSVIEAINTQLNGEYVVEYTFVSNADYRSILAIRRIF